MSEKRIYSVAIDGPSGAGKSTLAKAVSERLGILYVDTGAIYRSIGYYAFCNGIDPKDADAVVAALPKIRVEMNYGGDGLQHMLLNGEDVTDAIRLPQISMYASAVSAIPAVRNFLLEMQRDLAKKQSVIMDGRDIGTVVLPDADVKIFLFASAEVRAERRMKELAQRGTPRPYEEVLREIEERDYADTHRETAPLRPADDSIMIDTSEIGFDESAELLLDVIKGSVGL
jgi:cytidylate kinase